MVGSPRTVLHLCSTSGPGGAEMIVKRLATGLDPERFRSIVCLFRPGWLFDACQNEKLPTYIIKIDRAFDLTWAKSLFQLIKAEHVAAIHAHEFTANTYGTLIGKLAGIPVVATVHGKNYYVDQVKRRAAYRFVSRAAKMVAVSEDLKRFIVEQIHIPAQRIQVIYNGVETGPPSNSDQMQRVRQELALNQWKHVIGSVGSLYPVKGHIHLIHALPAVLRACPGTVLLCVGQGELEVALKAEAARLGVEEHIRFLGFRTDIPVLLMLMDVFVLPSLSEGLSMALLEAMAAGRSIVATKVGGNPELVEEGRTGYLVPAEKPRALADRIVSLLTDYEQARRFGERGKQRVEQEFSFAGMVSAYQECYAEGIGAH